MTPTIGRFVTLRGLYARSNGADECPAVITRVWPDNVINVTAFPDAKSPQPVTSVKLFADAGELAAYAAASGASNPGDLSLAYWPTRV